MAGTAPVAQPAVAPAVVLSSAVQGAAQPLALPTGTIPNVLVNNPATDTSSQDTQSETSIITFGDTVLVAFNDSGSYTGGDNKFTGWARSTDGGKTFTDLGKLPTNTNGDAGDPVLARDSVSGRIYFATLSFGAKNVIQVFRSDDNGLTFQAPINACPGRTGGSLDKEWMTVDNYAGAGQGNVYMVVRDFGSTQGIYFFKSTDGGATWGPNGGTLLASPGASNVQGAWVVVGPDHSLYGFWYDSTTSPQRLMMRKSVDFGTTWGTATQVASLLTTGSNGDLGLGFRTNAFLQAVVNPVSGNLYVVYNDNPAGTDRGDIYFTQSINGGTTWSTPVRVNDDATTRDQWQPVVAVKPNGSQLFVGWYDRRNDTANSLIDTYGVVGSISGPTVTFDANFRITSTSFPSVYGVDPVVNTTYMGDYDQAAADNATFYYVWGDNRDTSLYRSGKQANVRLATISTSLAVVSSTPANGAIVSTAPTDFVIQFSEAYRADSVQATDLTVNGLPADSVDFTDATTLTFHFLTSPVTVEGSQAIAIAADAILRASDSLGNAAFTSAFRYDTLTGQVASMVPASGSTVSLPLTSLTLNFNEPYLASSIGLGDLVLSQGSVTTFTLTSPTAVTYTLAGINAEGTLNVVVAAGAISDAAGNPFGAYSGSLVLDVGTAQLTGFATTGVQGGMVYQASVAGTVATAGDVDNYVVTLDGGQTLAISLTAGTGLLATLELRDSGGNLLASATASGAGAPLFLQSVPVAAAGSYTITVSSAGGSGTYGLKAVLNAALEAERFGGASNDTAATAQNIDSAFVALGGQATRASVLGINGTTGGSVISLTDFESGLGGFTIDNTGGGLWHLSTGRGTQTGHSATYSLYCGQGEGPSGGGTYNTGSRVTGNVTSPAMVLGANAVLNFNYVLQTEGSTSYDKSQVQITIDGGTTWTTLASLNGTAESTVWRAATPISLAAYGGLNVKLRWFFDTMDTGANGYEGWYVDDIQISSAGLPNPDYYSVTLNAGDSLSLALKRTTASGNIDLKLYNDGGTLLSNSFTGPTNFERVISDFVAPASGTYRIFATGDINTEYQLIATRNASFDSENNDGTSTAQRSQATPSADTRRILGNIGGTALSFIDFTELPPQPVDGVTVDGVHFSYVLGGAASTDATYGFVNPNPTAVNTATSLEGNAAGTLTLTFDNPASAVSFAAGFSTNSTSSSGVLVQAFDEAGNLVQAQTLRLYATHGVSFKEGHYTFAGDPVKTVVIAFQQSSDARFLLSELVVSSGNTTDYYAVTMTAGGTLALQTATPADGAGDYINTFNPRLRVLNSAGTQVATDDDSAPDLRNAKLTYVATTAGTYYVVIDSSTTAVTQGDYVLAIAGASTTLPAFSVSSSSIANNARMKTAPGSLTLTFNDNLRLDSVSAGDVLLDGVPLGGMVAASATSATFALPTGLSAGTHTISLPGGAVTDLQNTAVDPYAISFLIDTVPPRIIGTTVQSGEAKSGGSLTVSVTFSEPMLTGNLSSTDFTLRGNYRNTTYGAYSYAYNTAGTVATITYTTLPDDSYTLTLVSGDGAFEDSSGNNLDGEALAWPIPSNQTGDGVEGGNFVTDFFMDNPFAQAITATTMQMLYGGQVYASAVSTGALTAGDTDVYTLNLDAGQVLSLALHPLASVLTGEMVVLDPSYTPIGNVTIAAGQGFAGGGVTAGSTGTYTVLVKNTGTVSAGYQLTAILNGVAEAERFGGAADDTIATAQAIDSVFVSETPGMRHIGVLGDLTTASPTDYYAITLAAGESLSLAVTSSTSNTTLAIFTPDGTKQATGVAGLTNITSCVDNFVAPAAGTYLINVAATPGYSGTYTLAAVVGAAFERENGTINDTLANAQPLDGRNGVLGYIATSNSDYYAFTAAAGDSLMLRTYVPAGGPGDFGNALIPSLELYDSAGTKLAADTYSADGRNALISYSISAAGTYYVRVLSVNSGSGEYVLQVSGAANAAAPFAVTTTTPASGTGGAVAPTSYTVNFNHGVLLSSLSAGDLVITTPAGGTLSPTSVTVTDSDTVVFTLASGTFIKDGTYTFSLAAGSLADLSGQGLTAFAGTFNYDGAGPRIMTSTILENDAVAPGTTSLVLTFSEAIKTSLITTADFTLTETMLGLGTVTISSVAWAAGDTQLTLTFPALGEGVYTFRAISSSTGLTDLSGNLMDGERNTATTVPTGNGTAGGDFLLDFSVDMTTRALPVSFSPLTPVGSGAYRSGTANGYTNFSGDSDSFTVVLDAGQTLAFQVHPFGGAMQLGAVVTGPGGAVLGSATGAAGADVVLQKLAVASGGTYTISVTGTGGVGVYSIQAFLNTTLEMEEHGGPSNDTRGTAEALVPAPLSGGTGQGVSVLGKLPTGSGNVVVSEGFESGTLGPAWSTYSSLATGRIQVSGTYGTAAGTYALLMDNNDAVGTNYVLNEAIWTVNLAGLTQATLNFSTISFADDTDILPATFAGHYNADGVSVSTDGTNWRTIWTNSSPAAWTPVSVDLATLGLPLGANFLIKFQQYDNYNITTDGRGYDAISITTPAPSLDWYAVPLVGGQKLALTVKGQTGVASSLTLYDAAGALLATGVTTATNVGAVIDNFAVPTTGTYYVQVAGTTTEYLLSAYADAAFELEGNSSLATAQSLGGRSVVLGGLSSGSVPPGGSGTPFTGAKDFVGSPISIGMAADGSFTGPTVGMRFNSTEFIRYGTFLAGFTVSANGINYINSTAGGNGTAFAVTMTDLSAGGTHVIRVTGNPTSTLSFTRYISWNDGDAYALVTTALTNTGATALTTVALLDNDDPDPGNITTTTNDVTVDANGQFAVSSASAGAMALGSLDARAVASIEGFFIASPFDIINSPVDPNNATGDNTLNMAFNLGTLGAGQTATTTFAIAFGTTPGAAQATYNAIASKTKASIANDDDYFAVTLYGGVSYTFSTATPADGVGAFGNVLDPAIELYSGGSKVAADDNSGMDGRNAKLTFTPTVTGTYVLRLFAAGGTSGEYMLTMNTPAAGVAGSYIFYNNSAFDGHNPAADAGDDAAIATDKQALQPGQAASFANYTSYSQGINGIMVDVANLADAANLTVADFVFKCGNTGTPATWADAPAPTGLSVRSGAGAGGTDRVTLTWADQAISNQWLQVTIKATSHTGLGADSVFYFGNQIGETGNVAGSTAVDALDVGMIANHLTGFVPAAINNAWDIDRDKVVGALDINRVVNSYTGFTPLVLLTAPTLGANVMMPTAEVSVSAAPSSVPEANVPSEDVVAAATSGVTSLPNNLAGPSSDKALVPQLPAWTRAVSRWACGIWERISMFADDSADVETQRRASQLRVNLQAAPEQHRPQTGPAGNTRARSLPGS